VSKWNEGNFLLGILPMWKIYESLLYILIIIVELAALCNILIAAINSASFIGRCSRMPPL